MATGDRIVLFYVTRRGRALSEKLAGLYPGLVALRYSRETVGAEWAASGTLIFVMAAGIVVRAIAGLIGDKKRDPAVILLDGAGRNVVSLLSGHLGGANERAREIASYLGGHAVITTESDVAGMPSLDLWAREKDLVIENWDALPAKATRLLDEGRLNLYSEIDLDPPPEFVPTKETHEADLLVTSRAIPGPPDALLLRPRNLVAGIGCNSGTPAAEIEEALRTVLEAQGFSFLSLTKIATLDRKAEEPGIKAFCERYSLEVCAYTPDELNRVTGVTESTAARRATGAQAVAEPSAILGAGAETLLVRKVKRGNVTVALAEFPKTGPVTPSVKAGQGGKIFIVGTGPGGRADLTPRARAAIEEAGVIVGYGSYVRAIGDLTAGKEVFSSPMTREVERCMKAISMARQGKSVAVVSGGDPGIYGMAGLVFELLAKEGSVAPTLPVEVIPGISALNASAAVLGAPLMHDFASISLSDRLTEWPLIEKRLKAAGEADFVIVLYNPRSKGRRDHIGKAAKIIGEIRSPDTPVGIVRNATREGEAMVVTTLGCIADHEIDMATTVIIGNSRTFPWCGRMITPRGYGEKIASAIPEEKNRP